MNISTASCEYFYDEEYDVAINEGTYNQNFIVSLNNNNPHPFCNYGIADSQTLDLRESRMWCDSFLDKSENNNYEESLYLDKPESLLYKCNSIDNVIDTSAYSLSHNLPVLKEARENLFNYHLYFDSRKVSVPNSENFLNYDIKKHFAKRYGSKFFYDSGKGSEATSDSLINPNRFSNNRIATNSADILQQSSMRSQSTDRSYFSDKKTKRHFWQRLKQAFFKKKWKWSHLKAKEQTQERLYRSYSAPNVQCSLESNEDELINNRFSTTILELYHLLTNVTDDIVLTANGTVNDDKKDSKSSDFACQFPEPQLKLMTTIKRTLKRHNLDYPGLGKVKLPHDLRIPTDELVGTHSLLKKLQFLETPNDNSLINKSPRRSYSMNRTRCDRRNSRGNAPSRCSSESRYKQDSESNPNQRQTPETVGAVKFRRQASDLGIIDENKSISFSDLRPIPRSWGLNADNQVLAIFQFSRHSSAIQARPVEFDEENNIKLGALVSNALSCIRTLSDSVTQSQDITTICDKFIRSKDGNRQSASALLLTVDAILSLISEGLSVGVVRSKKGQVLMTGLWMFIEESCRGCPVKDASQKLAFGNLLKQVKQISSSHNAGSKTKEWLLQLKLQLFIALSIKNNLLHIWLKAVVANDRILNRFFSSSSFLRQSRTTYSNALSAVVVEIRHLSNPSTSRNYNIIGKPITTSRRRNMTNQPQESNSSSDSSLRSKIPRPSRKLSKG